MTAITKQVTRQRAWELILQDEHGLSSDDMSRFFKCIQATTKIWAGFFDDKLACIYGLIPPTLLDDYALLWLHVTKAVKDHEFIFARRSQIEIRNMLKSFDRLVGFCEAGAEDSQKWLRWLGATFDPPNEKMMLPFTIRRK